MSINNDVHQVLVTKGNQAVLAPGQTIDTLPVGGIGVFDANTNLSVDGSAALREFYIAVGVDEDGDTVTDSVMQSAGQAIQSKGIRAYSFRPHSAARPQIIELSDFKANCETEYSIALQLKNQSIYYRNGFNIFKKHFSVTTGCCTGCATCEEEDCNKLAKQLIDAMNSDNDNLVKAEGIDPATGNVIADLDAFIAANATVNTDPDDTNDVCMRIRITTIPERINTFCAVNLKYKFPRETVTELFLGEGFNCSGTITQIQEAAFEEGNGYDIKQAEYYAGGFNGKPGPYRVSDLLAHPTDGYMYFADESKKYDCVALTYAVNSVAGWADHNNDHATEIAIPSSDTATTASFLAVIDGLVAASGFDALADDAATADTDDTVVESTEDQTVDTDGIA